MTLQSYLYERRRGLAKTAGALGSVYFAGNYVASRLQEMRYAMVEERNARDNLRRRFAQNEQDATYMVLGLLPTLSEQILSGMDVEEITQELKNRSRSTRSVNSPPPPPLSAPAPPSRTSSDLNEASIDSENADSLTPVLVPQPAESTSLLLPNPSQHSATSSSSSAGSMPSTSLDLSSSSQSWVRDISVGPGPSSMAGSSAGPPSSSASVANEELSASATSSSPSTMSSTLSSQNKAELWREVKILTFTRTLTVLYSMTLLSLFTHIQLSVLNRSKYVQSVYQHEREDREREALFSDPASIPGKSIPGLATLMSWLSRADDLENIEDSSATGSDTEMKYLTLSWWLLHVGWKDVGERVRRAVEEVFDEVSLKQLLDPMELHRLLLDVRRRVEHEVTFEGKERRTDFLSALLPSTPETLRHVLANAGLGLSPPSGLPVPILQVQPPTAAVPADAFEDDLDPPFNALVAETSSLISSPNFAHVLEAALDEASESVLLAGLLSAVFGRREPDASTAPEDELVPKLRLVDMLPGLARWSRLALTGLPNELVDRLGEMREVRGISAVVFSAFSGSPVL